MIRSLIPFTQLTRSGIPEFEVCRLPLLANGAEIGVGQVLPVTELTNRTRLRQLYEQRRIQPVVPPVGSKQAAVAKQEAGRRKQTTSAAAPALVTGSGVPDLDFDLPDVPAVPVTIEPESHAYQPSRSPIRRKGVR